jgi:very-short-patch-repair endonuclease
MPRQQERYCEKLVNDVLGGVEYKLGYRFPFLRGDPTLKRPEGVTLPVDAYYPTFKLVLEFREGQHYGDRFDFRDSRITATGETRKEQRQKYDKRREEVLPANGIKLLVIYDYEITGNSEDDLRLVKQKLKSTGLLT